MRLELNNEESFALLAVLNQYPDNGGVRAYQHGDKFAVVAQQKDFSGHMYISIDYYNVADRVRDNNFELYMNHPVGNGWEDIQLVGKYTDFKFI